MIILIHRYLVLKIVKLHIYIYIFLRHTIDIKIDALCVDEVIAVLKLVFIASSQPICIDDLFLHIINNDKIILLPT